METRTPGWRKVLAPVLFTLVCAVLILATWRACGGDLPLQPKRYEVSLTAPDAQNLQTGGDVRVAGVRIGRVRNVDRDGNATRITIAIAPRFAPLREGTVAMIRAKSLLGEAFLELAPGRGPVVPEAGRLPVEATQPSQQLNDVLRTFEPGTRDDLRALFQGLAKATDGRAKAFSDAVGTAPGAVSSLAELMEVVDAERPDLSRLVSRSGDVLGALGDNEGALRAAVVNGNTVLETTADRRRELAATVRALPPFLGRLDRAARTIRGLSPELTRATATLRPAVAELPGALDEIDRAAPDFRAVFRDLPGLEAAGRRGLPPLTRLLDDSGEPLARIYRTSRDLIPFLGLVAADREEITGVFANLGGVLSGKTRLGDGRIVNYGSGVPTIWNETPAGWVRRLPSNRMNPYPKPGSARDIASGGLKAYDCRNTDNPNYLPPTGTGAPPCTVQGPWTYRGRTRFYPALRKAKP